ncbi:hypothetical protein LOTGIDRAFT_212357 [Lottia gigantea]|uniref:UBR-type domain-containing protein n=1 Tax=Lottia gigantea TaxID=225164 RepID=V4CKU8_LOTGI|nr:hypothetical protein LOTGIDRAFT_212357 [Lottia gigantea]ESP02860.1 hypothetical protein LOTGIDRAFT_212357 [Lottia gigantea]
MSELKKTENVPEIQINDAEGVSMVEILEEENRLKADAAAVLGASDDKNCTYDQGYIPRQALYACSTCAASSGQIAGICLACSYECHEGHDLYELYTKRYFRCDCGNEKFSDFECKLNNSKGGNNSRNKYNQNFKGLYCSCERPYPDPEDETEDEMIQCSLCEDWYHGRHLGIKDTLPSDYEEMICPGCINKHEFLLLYSPAKITEDSNADSNSCLLKRLDNNQQSSDKACFMFEGWRSQLCRCTTCQKMYEEKNISFILDEDDTVHAYEDKGLASHSFTDTNALPRALSQMDRVQQVELIHGYNDMKEGLREYLRTFAESGKVVKEEHIREFFSQMHTRKRQKTDSGFQYSCK